MNNFDSKYWHVMKAAIIKPIIKSKYIERIQRKRELVFLSNIRVFNIMLDRALGDKNV